MTFPSQAKYCLFKKETSPGTPVTPEFDVGLIITDISNSMEREVSESMGISDIEAQKISAHTEGGAVNITGEFQHGRLFELILGAVAHAETTGDWKHTFTVSNTTVASTIEVGNDFSTDVENTYPYMVVETSTLSIEDNGKLMLECNFIGNAPTDSETAATPVISTLPVFPDSLVNVKVNNVAATECQEASITITRTVQRSPAISSNSYQQIHATEIKFEYSAKLGFTDSTYHSLVADGTVHEFEINADNGTALGSGRRDVSMTLENCVGTGFDEPTTVGDLTYVTISGKGTLKECFSTDNISDTNWD